MRRRKMTWHEIQGLRHELTSKPRDSLPTEQVRVSRDASNGRNYRTKVSTLLLMPMQVKVASNTASGAFSPAATGSTSGAQEVTPDLRRKMTWSEIMRVKQQLRAQSAHGSDDQQEHMAEMLTTTRRKRFSRSKSQRARLKTILLQRRQKVQQKRRARRLKKAMLSKQDFADL